MRGGDEKEGVEMGVMKEKEIGLEWEVKWVKVEINGELMLKKLKKVVELIEEDRKVGGKLVSKVWKV